MGFVDLFASTLLMVNSVTHIPTVLGWDSSTANLCLAHHLSPEESRVRAVAALTEDHYSCYYHVRTHLRHPDRRWELPGLRAREAGEQSHS